LLHLAKDHRFDAQMIDYDLELHRYHAAFRGAFGIGRTDQVLDIGCGTGETTREAARTASEGGVLGIDHSEEMIQRARALALAEGLRNVDYECADVERYSFSPCQFDIAISRFGTMFFADPVSAFTRIRLALRPLGRLVMIVWQEREQNEWAVAIQRALAVGEAAPVNASATWQPFSLGDPRTVEHILHTAGFVDVTFDQVREAVFYGPDTDSAFAFVSQFLLVQETLRTLNSSDRERSLDRLRALLATHHTISGVWFDSRAWIVAARCA
jgi:ubiquinone/menaquinone biosynthesis C-methylase UbiE